MKKITYTKYKTEIHICDICKEVFTIDSDYRVSVDSEIALIFHKLCLDNYLKKQFPIKQVIEGEELMNEVKK